MSVLEHDIKTYDPMEAFIYALKAPESRRQYPRRLKPFLAVKHDIAVVITNQVSDRPESSGKYKPTGGNILGHFVTHRISLIERGPVILANLVISAYYPYTDCRLQIEDIGVTDAVEF